MLARALALNPKLLLLMILLPAWRKTEKKILQNISKNYPGLTLLSVTQKIAAVEHYDQIVVLWKGKLLLPAPMSIYCIAPRNMSKYMIHKKAKELRMIFY